MTRNDGGPAEILLVEDDPAEVLLTQEVLRESPLSIHINVVGDGEAALAFLRREGPYAASPRPELILLNLSLPKKDGYAVLQELNADPALRSIPVVVLTSSTAEQDRVKSYTLHAKSYVVKSLSLAQFTQDLQQLVRYWLVVNHPPPQPRE
jgi:chemotaxis family two-component system response regulator Rcp1